MGCQSSKAAKASVQTPGSLSPTKTLLDGAEAKKVVGHASQPAASSAAAPPTYSATENHDAHIAPAQPTSKPSGSSLSAGPAGSPVSAGGSGAGHDSRHEGALPVDSVVTFGSNRGLLKQRTLCSSNKELDIMVVEYSAHDSTVGSVLGRNCKEMQWKVMYDPEAAPIDIKLHVQEHKLHSNEVKIECDGQPIFSGAGSHAKAKMVEDFCYQWSFRGTIQGINEPNFFQFHPAHFSNFSAESWFPATITGQREDGYFEVNAQEPDTNGRIIEVKYPAVHKDNLREALTQKPLAVPENHLTLEVPKQDPLRAVLSVANGEHITHHFGRPSPPLTAGHQKPELKLKVSKDRGEVTANVGHLALSHFVSGEVQAKSFEALRLKHSWTVQLGPFAEHTIEVTKRYTLGKIVTLLVDGDVLVEASPADLGCAGSDWQCKFRFVGERVLDFEVYKTNTDGAALDETGHVKERRKYVHECLVTIPNDWDFTNARLFIDGTPFVELPMQPERGEEPNLTTSPLALLHSYAITSPYMVDRDAPSSMMMLATQVLVKASDTRKTAGGLFARCCDCSSVIEGDASKQK